ncbi:helix-turn-helix domain-containing protein, partial [Clostridium perfringens]
MEESIIHFPGWEDRAALLCRSVYGHFYHKDKIKRWKAQLDFQELLYGIITASGHPAGADKTQALERARSHMAEHYADELTMDQLAGIAELSPKYFAEVFRKAYGLSTMEYLTQIRLNKAKQLILGTGGRLRDVAHQV